MPIVNSVKEFLKPSWRKVLILIIFLFLSTSFSGGPYFRDDNTYCDSAGKLCTVGGITDIDFRDFGFPLKWLTIMYFWRGVDGATANLNLVTNLIFWYLISCLIVFAYDKIKNSKKRL